VPEAIQLHESSSCLIIDGRALIVGFGKPADARTFGDLADTYVKTVLKSGLRYQRIDVIFNRCRKQTIKSTTRVRRSKAARPIRWIV
jgi:hypothetical protein